MLINEKLDQAIGILKEKNIDMWLIFVRETSTMSEPVLPFVLGTNATWQSAFIITSKGEKIAIVGSLDANNIETRNIYDKVLTYVDSIKPILTETLTRINPKQIAINYSQNSNMSDGLTHGMYILLETYLKDTPFLERLISAEDIISALLGRKTKEEVKRLQKAVDVTLEIINELRKFIRSGLTEKEVAEFMLKQVRKRNIETSWDEEFCPSVFTGPESAGAHSGPTDRKILPGHLVNIDFGVKIDDYVSDLQRSWYVLKPNETKPPEIVLKGFNAVRDGVKKAREQLKPGLEGKYLDSIARNHIVSEGFDEYPHALGHQVGRKAHDGGGLLCPEWERYGNLPFLKTEVGQVYTLEPRVILKDYGVATIEDMVVVTEDGCKSLSGDQEDLWLIK